MDRDAIDIISGDEYSFLDTEPCLGQNVDSVFLGGSNAYGLQHDVSDMDVRGFAMRSAHDILTGRDFETSVHPLTDTTIYSFDKFVSLLSACNPNIIEFLGLRDDAYLHIGHAGRMLLDNADAFVSRRAAKTFGGYAMSQLNRIEGALGRNSGTDEARQRAERRSMEHCLLSFADRYASTSGTASISMSDTSEPSVDIHMDDVPIGVCSDMLSQLQSVSRSYDKMNGKSRRKDAAHLSKHMSHLIRLYHMGTEILDGKGVITNRQDAGDADMLMEIKTGAFTSDDGTHVDSRFFDIVREASDDFERAEASTRLRDDCDAKLIDGIIESENRRVIES